MYVGSEKQKLCTVRLHILQQAKDGPVKSNEEKVTKLIQAPNDLITCSLSLHCQSKIWGGGGEKEEKWAIGASELEGRPNALGFEQSVWVGLSEGENSFQLWFHWSWVTRPDVCHFFSTNVLLGSIFLHMKARKLWQKFRAKNSVNNRFSNKTA